nr:reverse transcriptase domain-containing protein [Tanacetum cinerariifolium]
MRTRSSSNFPVVSSNPPTSKCRNRRRSQQPFILEESPVDTMADQRTMAELLRAPTEGYAEEIMVPPILAEQFELKHSLINMMSSDQFFRLKKDNPHDHIRCGAHPYYQCHAAGGKTFPELRDNIQGYVLAAAVHYNQGNPGFRPPGGLDLPSNIIANPKGELKAITTHIGLVIDGPTVPTPPQSINLEVDERVEETFTDPNLAEYTIKVPPPPVQKYKPSSQREYVVHQRDPLHSNIPYPSRMLKEKQQEKDEVQIHKFWQMFKQLHINITLADALILMPKYQKMLKALLSNKEKLQELANTPLNENSSAVILKKLLEKLGDRGKFLISCGFSELKCKALADLGASINLMPLSVWKKLGLPELISTCMTLELANRVICTPAEIARDVFVSVGKFTFLADFVIVDYKSDPRVLLILGRPFLRTARALINVHGEEMIICDGDERLILNIRHDTSSYSNQPQRESINVINIFNNSKGGNVLSEKLLDLDSTKDLHPPLHDNPLSGNTTYSFNPLLEEFVDELALITFPLKYDDLQFDIEFDLKEIEFLLYQDVDFSLKDSIDLANPADNVVDSVPEMFTDKHALDYSSPPIFDEYDDDFLEIESDAENVYDDPFDSKGEKIKESKLLIDELNLLFDFLLSKYDSFISQGFSRVDALPSTNNEDKIFNLGILIQEKSCEIITRVVQDNKLATSNASSMLEDFDPPLYEPLFFKEVPKMLLPFSSENEERVFKPGQETADFKGSDDFVQGLDEMKGFDDDVGLLTKVTQEAQA